MLSGTKTRETRPAPSVGFIGGSEPRVQEQGSALRERSREVSDTENRPPVMGNGDQSPSSSGRAPAQGVDMSFRCEGVSMAGDRSSGGTPAHTRPHDRVPSDDEPPRPTIGPLAAALLNSMWGGVALATRSGEMLWTNDYIRSLSTSLQERIRNACRLYDRKHPAVPEGDRPRPRAILSRPPGSTAFSPRTNASSNSRSSPPPKTRWSPLPRTPTSSARA